MKNIYTFDTLGADPSRPRPWVSLEVAMHYREGPSS